MFYLVGFVLIVWLIYSDFVLDLFVLRCGLVGL